MSLSVLSQAFIAAICQVLENWDGMGWGEADFTKKKKRGVEQYVGGHSAIGVA